jgi:hypothetical protein
VRRVGAAVGLCLTALLALVISQALAKGPPITRITKHAVDRVNGVATFKFKGLNGAHPFRFECKLDEYAWRRCKSPYRITLGRAVRI